MRLTFRLTIALLTFSIGVATAIFWFAYHRPSVQTLENPPCASPPNYEMPSVPCSGTDFSALSSLPVIPYCDLVRDSALHENQIIRVSGVYSFNMENSALDDPTCRNENAWTWVESEPYSNFEERMKPFYAIYGSKIKSGGHAEVIFLGKFYGPTGKGYGHLDGYRFKLSVMHIEEMKSLTLNAP